MSFVIACGARCCEGGVCCCVAKNEAVTVHDLWRFEVSRVSLCKVGNGGRGLGSLGVIADSR